MTGNDIVDLQAAGRESNWQRKGFLEKICTREELQYIIDSDQPDKTCWRLWTMKESAYKVHMRHTRTRSFAPQKLACYLAGSEEGTVQIEGHRYRCVTRSTDEYVYSTAVRDKVNSSPLFDHCFLVNGTDPSEQQAFIYQTIVNGYNRFFNPETVGAVVLKDSLNIPYLRSADGRRQLPLSITHHGRYAAFTIN